MDASDPAEGGGGSPPPQDQSLVGKFVSGIISNTPLSKWFGRQQVRTREEDAGEEMFGLQPPTKRPKKAYSFPEPVAGPSGVRPKAKPAKESDSEESTSGYSSVARIGSKEQVGNSQESSKQASPLENSPNKGRGVFQNATTSSRSLFAERSVSPNMNSSMSSRRPSFNASAFGSPNFVDRTISTQKIVNSPFYSGRTVYGGASAYGRALGRSSKDLKANLRKTIKIKPVNKTEGSGNVQLGKTARRILDTLEQYSTPVQDAKKIPVSSKKSRSDGMLSRYTGANPYTLRVPSNKELQVPSVSDLLKMKQSQQKTRLQDSTEAVRQIATLSKSTLNEETYKITTTEKDQEKHTTKMKTKISSVRHKTVTEETHSEPKLNPVALPIKTLPKFDIKPPEPQKNTISPPKIKEIPVSKPSNSPKRPLIVDPPFKTAEKSNEEFTFSEPKILGENLNSIVGINDFKFSEPLCKKNKPEVKLNFKMPENNPIVPKLKNNGETIVKTAPVLKTGSVMDVLGKKDGDSSLLDKFKPPENSWECSVCLIRNKAEAVKCAACETPRKKESADKTTNVVGFGDKFKPPSATWECPACLIRNKEELAKCAACETPKPTNKPNIMASSGSIGEKFDGPKQGFTAVLPPISKKIIPIGFDGKFVPPPDTWECDTCLVRNNDTLTKCAACETPKKTKTPQHNYVESCKNEKTEWECEVCMVKNKKDLQNCQCCEAAKPGLSSASSILKSDKPAATPFNFGVDKGTASVFTFGVPQSQQKTTNTNAGSIFGSSAKTAETATVQSFSFGVPPQKNEESKAEVEPKKANPLLKVGEKLPEEAKVAPAGFSFGVPPEKKPEVSSSTEPPKTEETKKPPANGDLNKPTFTFTPPKTPAAFNFEPPKTLNNPTFKFESPTVNFGVKTETAAPKFSVSAAPTKFGSSSNDQSFINVPPATKPSTFGGSSNVPTFGKSSSNPATTFNTSSSNPATTFNTSSSNVTTTTTAGFGGSSNVPTFTEVKPFSFGSSTASSDSQKGPVFSFGGPLVTRPAATQPTGGFSFGSTAPSPAGFSFGKTGAFGGAPKENANIFNASAPPAAAAPSINGGFNFGATTSNVNSQKAGFNFGASATNSTPQTTFNFGSSSATGGFSFSAAPQPPVFDANAKPTFNFTAGGSVAAFSAPPASEGAAAPAPRKIKRAVRRTQR